MSLGDWLRSLFGGSRRRDISRLSPGTSAPDAPGGLDQVSEQIDLSGRPLKEHHRRRGLRDRRLLPKVKSPARQLRLTKKSKVMSATEAGRLFGGTQRTRNRNYRDLLADADQLQRLGLPVWKTEEELAAALGISPRELWFFSIHRQKERQPHYVTFAIPKRSGGRRLIMAPKRRLKKIQRQLLEMLISRLPVSERAHAFRPGRNVRTGAEPHLGRRMVLHLDLKDFFPSITVWRVRGFLIACGYSFPVATTLAVLMTEAERQPVSVDGQVFHVPVGNRHCVQGAPTSPGISNALLLRLDRRLHGLAQKRQATFTRYADDLTFSGDFSRGAADRLRMVVSRIVKEEGFELNPAKSRLMGRATCQRVTGVVVNQTLGLSRKERRRWRAMAHQLKYSPDPKRTASLHGKLAYLAMLNPIQAASLARHL